MWGLRRFYYLVCSFFINFDSDRKKLVRPLNIIILAMKITFTYLIKIVDIFMSRQVVTLTIVKSQCLQASGLPAITVTEMILQNLQQTQKEI